MQFKKYSRQFLLASGLLLLGTLLTVVATLAYHHHQQDHRHSATAALYAEQQQRLQGFFQQRLGQLRLLADFIEVNGGVSPTAFSQLARDVFGTEKFFALAWVELGGGTPQVRQQAGPLPWPGFAAHWPQVQAQLTPAINNQWQGVVVIPPADYLPQASVLVLQPVHHLDHQGPPAGVIILQLPLQPTLTRLLLPQLARDHHVRLATATIGPIFNHVANLSHTTAVAWPAAAPPPAQTRQIVLPAAIWQLWVQPALDRTWPAWRSLLLLAALAWLWLAGVPTFLYLTRARANRLAQELAAERNTLAATVTAAQASNAALAAANTAAAATARLKAEFLAVMSHEIRTPLNGILGMVNILHDTHPSPIQQKYLRTLQDCSDTLLMTLNDVLDFSRLEAGKVALEQAEIQWVSLVEGVVGLYAPLAQQKGLRLCYAIDPNLPTHAVGDATRLRQVLQNLVNNAVKFTAHGGVMIRLRGRASEAGPIQLRLEVEDTGPGVAPDKQALLFDSFTQLDSALTRRQGGSGLGLAICKKIVTLMNGQIGVTSVLRQGSLFWVELTLPALAYCPYQAPAYQALQGKTALVLDPSTFGQEACHNTLTRLGLRPLPLEAQTAPLATLATLAQQQRQVDVAVVYVDDPTALPVASLSHWQQRYPGVVQAWLPVAATPAALALAQQAWGLSAGLLLPVTQHEMAQQLLLALQLPSMAAATQATDHTARRRGRILVVEDNAINQQVLRLQLEKLGQVVTIAADGLEALKKLQHQPFDLVFMDMQMPELDGLSATRQVRAWGPPYDKLPIIALTANAFASDREACLAAGMTDYLSKPVAPERLIQMLDKYLGPAVKA